MVNIVMVSAWRDDVKRNIYQRAEHLLRKTYPNLRWLWIEGDSKDETYQTLLDITDLAPGGERVTVVHRNVNHDLPGPEQRLIRLSKVLNIGLDNLPEDTDMVIWHESDLQSPEDIVERLLDVGQECVGGWPMMMYNAPYGRVPIFYDIWAYRAKGKNFSNYPPHHEVYTPDQPFEVDTIGSVYMFPAREVLGENGIRTEKLCVVELYKKLKDRGYSVWVDPRIIIVQPDNLWVEHQHYGME